MASSRSYKHHDLEYPRFRGEGAVDWLIECEMRFVLQHVKTDREKIAVAALHMDGPALTWYTCNARGLEELSWVDFAKEVKARFTKRDEEIKGMIKRRNKLVAQFAVTIVGMVVATLLSLFTIYHLINLECPEEC